MEWQGIGTLCVIENYISRLLAFRYYFRLHFTSTSDKEKHGMDNNTERRIHPSDISSGLRGITFGSRERYNHADATAVL